MVDGNSILRREKAHDCARVDLLRESHRCVTTAGGDAGEDALRSGRPSSHKGSRRT